jgi:hypothetical protein
VNAEAASAARVGLPYGILYVLLCIILLLLTFIFLRDKDLRLRLNVFLSGAKRRMNRARLKLKLNRETRKRIDLLKALGKQAWQEKFGGAKYEPFYRSLESLEDQSQERQAVLGDAHARFADLQRKLDEARQSHKRMLRLKDAGEPIDGASLRVFKELAKRHKKDMRAEEKWALAEQEALRGIDRRKDEQFEGIGRLADAERPAVKDVQGIYVQIDTLNRKILYYMSEIEKLR